MRRDQVLLTTPIQNEAYTALSYEPEILISVGARKLRGHVRVSGPGHKFLRSDPFEIDVTDAVLNTLMNYVQTQLVAQRPALAGVRTVVEVTDVDADPLIG